MKITINNKNEEEIDLDEVCDNNEIDDEFMNEFLKEFNCVVISKDYLNDLETKAKKMDNFIKSNTPKKETNEFIIHESTADKLQQYHNKLNKYKSVKIVCECGKAVQRRNIAKHKRTKQHLLFMAGALE